MQIYDINPADGTVISRAGREAPKDPMRQTPRIPANATDIEPPATGEHEAARWGGGDWEVVPDYRGHVYYTEDGERHEITELGAEPPTENISTKPRPSQFHNLKSGKWIEDKQAALENWRATTKVSARQAMEQLIRAGLDEDVNAAVNAIEDSTERKLTRNWLDRAGTWERNNEQFISMGEALGLSAEEMDEQIKAAQKL